MHIVGHGGGCCGSKHLAGFGTADNAYRDILAYGGNVDLLNASQRVEVILNQTQVRNSPNTLNFLANLGFVLVEVYSNSNSGQRNYVFTRSRDRTEVGLARHAEEIRWNGQIMTGSLRGELPRTVVQIPPTLPVPQVPRFAVGETVRVRSRASIYNGRLCRIVSVRSNAYYHLVLDEQVEHGGRVFNVGHRITSEYHFSLLEGVENRPQPRLQTFQERFEEWLRNHAGAMQHAVDENEQVYVQQQQPVPAQPPAPPREEVVAGSTFHNVYRDGREGAGYPSLDAAREARRGNGRVIRRDYVVNADGVAVVRNTVVAA